MGKFILMISLIFTIVAIIFALIIKIMIIWSMPKW